MNHVSIQVRLVHNAYNPNSPSLNSTTSFGCNMFSSVCVRARVSVVSALTQRMTNRENNPWTIHQSAESRVATFHAEAYTG